MTQQEANRLFMRDRYVFLKGGARVDTSAFVAKISPILSRLSEEMRLDLTVLYVYNDNRIPTICVDENNNLYISVNYVYSALKMKEELVHALLLHACEYVYNSDLSQERFFLSKGMPRGSWFISLHYGNPIQLTLPLHHTINIAANISANNFVIKKGIASKDVLREELKSIALKEHDGLLLNVYYHKTELMDKWKVQVGITYPLTPTYRDELKTYFSGYMNTMREVIKSLEK